MRTIYFEKFNRYKHKYYLAKINKDKIRHILKELKDIKLEIETIRKLRDIYETRRKRNIRAVISLALFVLCFELSLFIITDVIVINPLYAMILGTIGIIFLTYGLYLIIHNPPIYVE